MDTTISGDKPQLKMLNLIQASKAPAEDDYQTKLGKIIADLHKQKTAGQFIELKEALRFIDPKKDNSLLVDWLSSNKIADKAKFDKVLRQLQRQDMLDSKLGFQPRDVSHFVNGWLDRNHYSVTFLGEVKCAKPIEYDGLKISAADAAELGGDVACIHSSLTAMPRNILQVKRDLRLANANLTLGFTNSAIDDAVDVWSEKQREKHKVEMLLNVNYERGPATGPMGDAMWQSMETAAFDLSDTQPGFAIAVLKKFIWQVKRKAFGIPVTRHLMPVLTGVQNKGKSTFVEAMCAPLADLKKNVSFGEITDDRIIDIWQFHILFVDEMARFTQRDGNDIKNVITARTLTRRPMRSNETMNVVQSATLIGTSNESLAQLSRDTTGGRRFAELVWKQDPDFTALNNLDWTMLWKSVDPTAADPINNEMFELLSRQQEDNRARSPVEIWAREFTQVSKAWRKASDLHLDYQTWEQSAFPRAQTDIQAFGRTLTNLINAQPDFPFEKRRSRTGIEYRRN